MKYTSKVSITISIKSLGTVVIILLLLRPASDYQSTENSVTAKRGVGGGHIYSSDAARSSGPEGSQVHKDSLLQLLLIVEVVLMGCGTWEVKIHHAQSTVNF